MPVARGWQRDLAQGICPTHGTPMNEVCGEHVCGTCYGQRLVTEPMPKGGYPLGPELVLEYNPTKHMNTYSTRRQGG